MLLVPVDALVVLVLKQLQSLIPGVYTFEIAASSRHAAITAQIYLPPAITITNKPNHNVIDYDYTESIHDYICLETSSERKQILFVW